MNKKIIVMTLWLFIAILLPVFIKPDSNIPVLSPLSDAPLNFGNWQYTQSVLTEKQDLLKERVNNSYNKVLLRNYTDQEGFTAEVQIFYCNSRLPRNRLTALMNMVNCLHGHFYFFSEKKVRIDDKNEASQLYLGRDGNETMVIYWLQSSGKISSSGNEHLAWQYKQGLRFRRTDGCFIKIAYYGTQTPEKNRKLLGLANKISQGINLWLNNTIK